MATNRADMSTPPTDAILSTFELARQSGNEGIGDNHSCIEVAETQLQLLVDGYQQLQQALAPKGNQIQQVYENISNGAGGLDSERARTGSAGRVLKLNRQTGEWMPV